MNVEYFEDHLFMNTENSSKFQRPVGISGKNRTHNVGQKKDFFPLERNWPRKSAKNIFSTSAQAVENFSSSSGTPGPPPTEGVSIEFFFLQLLEIPVPLVGL